MSARAAALATWQADVSTAAPKDDREHALSEALSQDLARVAAAGVAKEGFTLDLKCTDADGCEYRGRWLDATIHRDGSVAFRERSLSSQVLKGVAEPTSRPASPEDYIAPQRLEARLRFAVAPTAAERSWFLEQTAALRAAHSHTWHQRLFERENAGLRIQLEHIWTDPSASVAAKRRSLFEQWDATSLDELGARHREIVLAYIRGHVPADSAVAYSAVELATLNRQRQQPERFEPYSAQAQDAKLP